MHKSDQNMPILHVIDSLPLLLDVVTLRQNGGHQFADTAHKPRDFHVNFIFFLFLQCNPLNLTLFSL
jgi:hypothetical protein